MQIGEQPPTPAQPGPPSSAAPAAPVPAAPPGFIEFRDPNVGIALDYPPDWERLQPSDPQILMIAVKDPQDSFLVRAVDLQSPVGPAELTAAKQLTDKVVLADKTITVLSQLQVTLAGLPGYHYLYTFTDPTTGKLAAHSHFFVFKDKKMISLVFQVIPSDQFRGEASIFDKITASLRVI